MTQQPGYLRGFPAGNWNWTSAVIDGTITFEDICRWMDESYAATKTKTKTSERHCRKKSSREWMDSMSFFELASERYSERYFDSRPVEQEKIDKILEAGRTSPTACNYQPQRIYLMQSEEALKKVRGIWVSHFNAPLMILVCYDAREVWRNPGDRYYENYNSGEQDASIAATTMMYEAEELGVHTIWVRGFDSKSVVDTFGLPEYMIPVMMLGLGYPNEKAKPNGWHFRRRPIEEFVREL